VAQRFPSMTSGVRRGEQLFDNEDEPFRYLLDLLLRDMTHGLTSSWRSVT
jgi:hypothetical protein